MGDLLSRAGIPGIGFLYTLEVLGIPVPIEIPLWLSGQMLVQGQASYWVLVLATWSGVSAGNLLAYGLAQVAGRPVLQRLADRLGLQSQVQRVQGWIERYGLGAVVFTRWINWGYALSMWLIGFSQLPPALTLGVISVNTALWACAWVLLGRVLVGALHLAGLPGWAMLVPGAVMLTGLGIWRLISRLRTRNRPGT